VFFSSELNPVAPKAQKKVPIPDGLDLDAWINEPPSESEGEEVPSEVFVTSAAEFYGEKPEKPTYQPTEEELTKQREARKVEQDLNPHYLKPSSKVKAAAVSNDSDMPPVATLDLNVPLKIPGLISSDKYLNVPSRSKKNAKKTKKKKRSKNKGSDEDANEDADAEDSSAPTHVVNTTIDMPEGATVSDNEDSHLPEDDPHRALNVDLDNPLEAGESIPVPSHRVTRNPNYLNNTATTDKQKKPVEEVNDKKLTEKVHRKSSKTKHKKHSKDKSKSEAKSSKLVDNEINLMMDPLDELIQPAENENGTDGLNSSSKASRKNKTKESEKANNRDLLGELLELGEEPKTGSPPPPVLSNGTKDEHHADLSVDNEEASTELFAQLLAAGALSYENQLEFRDNKLSFQKACDRLQKKCHLKVVEIIETSALLHKKSSKGFHIFLLVKELGSSSIGVSVKSESEEAAKKILSSVQKQFRKEKESTR
jgi:AP-3 complex subunit delta-1